ncbi:hypothetical protein AAVH_07556 [Aphelenchoides avenae]|nr:hypothetical protein AAVH_07556 [Aphelenchus avenae]
MFSVTSVAAASQAVIKLDDDEVIDVCAREHPCENGGKCFLAPMAPSSYVCQCREHYHGNNCEEEGIVALPREYFVLRIFFITLSVVVGAVTFAAIFYRWRVVGKHQKYRLRSIKDLTDTKKPMILLPTVIFVSPAIPQLLI